MRQSILVAVLALAAADLFAQSHLNSTIFDERRRKPAPAKAEPAPEVTEEPVFFDVDFVVFAPPSGREYMEFVIGEDTQTYTGTRYLSSFAMNRYETTYRLWYEVRRWAEEHGYYFQNVGQEGSDGVRGRAPTRRGQYQPVTMVNWHDVMVWCNAYSEKEGFTPCYTYGGEVLRDSGDAAGCDLADCDWTATGYRLPLEAEWEYAARKTSSGMQRGDLASGQVDRQGRSDEGVDVDDIAWTASNAERTHIVGTAGTSAPKLTALPEPGSGRANGAGLFDMTGNVLEFCWDWYDDYADSEEGQVAQGPEYGLERVLRGASWFGETPFTYAGDRYSYDPNVAYSYLGFRLCRSQ